MGTKFFHSAPGGKFPSGGSNQSARAFNGSSFMARSAGSAAQKDVAGALAMAKMKAFKSDRGSAYAPGPKKV